MDNTSKKRKRKNIKVPSESIQNESLEIVISPSGPIKSTTVTQDDKEILLQRLKIELLDKYLNSSKESNSVHHNDVKNNAITFKFFRKCLIVGTNECTRALEMSCTSSAKGLKDTNREKMIPSLVMLATDNRPPTILAHIPCLCMQLGIPILLLPGKASSEVGKIFNIKQSSILLFMSYDKQYYESLSTDERNLLKRLNSYVAFAISKMPLPEKNKILLNE